MGSKVQRVLLTGHTVLRSGAIIMFGRSWGGGSLRYGLRSDIGSPSVALTLTWEVYNCLSLLMVLMMFVPPTLNI